MRACFFLDSMHRKFFATILFFIHLSNDDHENSIHIHKELLRPKLAMFVRNKRLKENEEEAWCIRYIVSQ